MSEHEYDEELGKPADPENPAEHIDLLPAETQPTSSDGLATAAQAATQFPMPKTLADAIVSLEEIGIEVSESRFRQNRPQADFVRLPWPLATRDPDDEQLAIWWYAAGIYDGRLYLEGMRGPDVRKVAHALAYRPPRTRAADLVEDLAENEPQPGLPKGQKGARGAGARQVDPDAPSLPVAAVPGDCEIVFRHMVEGEIIGTWKAADVAKYVMLELWGLHSHPEYVKMKQHAQGWKESKAEGLYPDANASAAGGL